MFFSPPSYQREFFFAKIYVHKIVSFCFNIRGHQRMLLCHRCYIAPYCSYPVIIAIQDHLHAMFVIKQLTCRKV